LVLKSSDVNCKQYFFVKTQNQDFDVISTPRLRLFGHDQGKTFFLKSCSIKWFNTTW